VPSPKKRASARISAVRARRPFVDHLVRMQEHYGYVDGSQQAGAVTYYGFLSFFPILALAFFAVGYLADFYPDAQDNLRTAIQQVMPGMIGRRNDQISFDDLQKAASAAGVLGFFGLLYTGLGWLSSLREALLTVFGTPERAQPGFLRGKLRDLRTLMIVGATMVVAIAVTSFIGSFSKDIVGWMGLGAELAPLLRLLTVALGLLVNALLFFALFRLLAEPPLPRRSLVSGAVLGAVGFEALKQLSGALLAHTQDRPAFQAFGIALILLVWINYSSRVVIYAAAFAQTSPEARALRSAGVAPPVQGPRTPALCPDTAPHGRTRWVAPFAAGGATALAVGVVLRKRLIKDRS
jgi:membrane protein